MPLNLFWLSLKLCSSQIYLHRNDFSLKEATYYDNVIQILFCPKSRDPRVRRGQSQTLPPSEAHEMPPLKISPSLRLKCEPPPDLHVSGTGQGYRVHLNIIS